MSALTERYLDRLFDLLSGTGAAGRRTLAETEAHLDEKVEDLVAQGRTPEAAAHEAIARFGPPETVAAAVAGTHHPTRLVFRQVIASVWVFAATILITSGVSGGLCWLVGCMLAPAVMAPNGPAMIHDAQACAVLATAYPLAHDCMNAAMMYNFDHMVRGSLIAGLAGCTLLALYFAARSSRHFAALTELPPKSYLFVASVTAFGFAAAVWFLDGIDDYEHSVSWDWSHDFARSAASLLTALFFVVAAYRHVRHDPRPGHAPHRRAA